MASPCYDLVPGGAFAAFTTQVQAKMMLNRGLCSSCVLYFLINEKNLIQIFIYFKEEEW